MRANRDGCCSQNLARTSRCRPSPCLDSRPRGVVPRYGYGDKIFLEIANIAGIVEDWRLGSWTGVSTAKLKNIRLGFLLTSTELVCNSALRCIRRRTVNAMFDIRVISHSVLFDDRNN